jgi:hypothetical protein
MADPFANAPLPTSDPFATASLPASDPFASAPISGGVQRSAAQPGRVGSIPGMMPTDQQAGQIIPQGAMIGAQDELMPRHNNAFDQFLINAGKDTDQLMQGLGVLGSTGVRRMADRATPQRFIDNPIGAAQDALGRTLQSPQSLIGAVNNFARPNPLSQLPTEFLGNPVTGQKPLVRIFGNQNESSDIPAAVEMTGNVLQDYAKNYIDPAMTGNFKAIGQHAFEHPLMTGLDALAAGGMGKTVLQGGLGIARKVAPLATEGNIELGQALGGAAKNYAKQQAATAAGAVGQSIASTPVGAALLGGAKKVIDKAVQWNTISKALYDTLAKHDKAFRQELKEQFNWVAEAYKKIPKGINDEELTNAITLRDMDAYQRLMQSPAGEAVQSFMDRLNSVNKWLAGRLIGVGAMTEEEAKAATYGPYALKKAQDATGNPNLTHAELTAQDVAEAEAELNDFGVEPVYLGIIPKPVSSAVRSGTGQLFGGIGRTSKNLAGEQVETNVHGEVLKDGGGKVYYHGTNTSFDKFKTNPSGTNALGEAVYLTDSVEAADDWAKYKWADQGMQGAPNIRPVHALVKKVFDTAQSLSPDEIIKLANEAAKYGSHQLFGAIEKGITKAQELFDLIPDKIKSDVLKGAGYDAVRFVVDDGSEELAVLHPEAVKSVFEGAKPAPPINRPGFLTPRQIGKFDPMKHEANPLHAFQTRLTEGLGFLHFYDALGDVLQHPELSGHVVGNAVNFPIKANLTDLAGKAGLAGVEFQGFIKGLPDVIQLPGRVAKELNRVMASQPGILEKFFLEYPRRILTTTTLGLNVNWAVMQNVQNGLISVWSMFKGPDDFARSFMAYMMATDERAAKVASEWVYDAHAERVVTEVPEGLAKLGAKAANIFNKVTGTVFGIAQAGDNYFRVVKGLHTLMREAETAEPAARLPLAKAFDLQARFDQVERAATDAAYAAKAAEDIYKWYFDYGPQMADKWRMARNGAPYFLWWLHSIQLLKTAALETPVKNAILAKVAAAAPDSMQKGVDDFHKKMGMVPMFDLEGNKRKGPNGGDLLMGRSGFLPFTQPFELVKQGAQILSGSVATEDREGLPPLAPIITFLVGTLGHRNTQNMSPWVDPRLVSTSGQHLKQGENDKGIPVDSAPNPFQLAARSLMPTQEAGVRDLSTRGIQLEDGTVMDAVPSDFSNPFEAAPKQDSEDHPLKNFTPLQSAFYSVTKMKPTEVTRTQEEADAMEENLQKKYRFVRDHYQAERQKPVLTAIGRIIAGRKK